MVRMSAVAVFNSDGGKLGHGSYGGVWRAPASLYLRFVRCYSGRDRTYGPISEGVTGSEGGGGRLIRVGADILIDAVTG